MIGLSFSFDYIHAYNWSLERLQFCFFSSLAVLALRYLGLNVGYTLLRVIVMCISVDWVSGCKQGTVTCSLIGGVLVIAGHK